jgi:hypothetical protein
MYSTCTLQAADCVLCPHSMLLLGSPFVYVCMGLTVCSIHTVVTVHTRINTTGIDTVVHKRRVLF